MAVPAYTEDLTDIDLAAAASTGVAINVSGGGGAAPAAGADLAMQGPDCWDRQVSSHERGIGFSQSPGTGTVAAGVHIFSWGFVATPGITDTLALRGAWVWIGSSATVGMQFHVEGSDTYGALGRVGKCYCVDYHTTAQTDRVPYATANGTPPATPTFWGFGCTTNAAAKGSNLGADAIRYGTGAYLTAGELISAGDGSDDPCTFVGFNVQNDTINNRWGILTSIGGSNYELQGIFAIGQNNTPTATLCRFRDSDKSINVVDTVHSASNFTQFIFDHASTRVEWNNINITALGGWNKGLIDITANDPDVFFTGGTFTGIGVSTLQVSTTADGTTWRACGEITANGATLANSTIIHGAEIIDAQDETSYDNSPTTEGSFVGGTTGHVAADILVLDDDTVIVVDLVSAGVVTQFTVDATRSKVFAGVRSMVATDGAGDAFTLTPDTDNYTNSSGLIWDTAADPNGELDDMVFDTLTSEQGHAIEFGTTSPLTMTLTGIDFGTNYSSTADGSVGNETFRFLRTTGTITLNLVGCSGNFGYQKEAGATVVISAAIPISVGNVTRGTPITVIAKETIGAVTVGDVLLQGFADATGEVAGSHNDEGTIDVSVRARNQGVATAIMAEDGGVFVDETEEGSSTTTADMTLLPAVPVANDAYNFGHQDEFTRLKLFITTAMTFSVQPTIIWEYWNGAWVSLTGVVDGTSGFETAGSNIVSWTLPGDWVARSLTNQANVGSLFYVRARLSVLGTITVVPIGQKVQIDTTRYLPYAASRSIETGVGLADNATWQADTISKFDPDD